VKSAPTGPSVRYPGVPDFNRISRCRQQKRKANDGPAYGRQTIHGLKRCGPVLRAAKITQAGLIDRDRKYLPGPCSLARRRRCSEAASAPGTTRDAELCHNLFQM
jgi:hypothetical protein